MRKNKMMRAASALLVAVLLTTSTISGTFAKYVSEDSAEDSARVAKWGVELQLVGNLYGDSYGADDKIVKHDDTSVSVQSLGAIDDVVAPGTKSDEGLNIKLNGQPEVDGKITTTIEFQNIYLKEGRYGIMVEVAEGTVTAANFDEFDAGTFYKLDGTKYVEAAVGDVAGTLYTLEDEVTLHIDADDATDKAYYYPVVYDLYDVIYPISPVKETAGVYASDSLAAVAAKIALNLEHSAAPTQDPSNASIYKYEIETFFESNDNLANDFKLNERRINWEWKFEINDDLNKADTILGHLMAGNVTVVRWDGTGFVLAKAVDATNINDYCINSKFVINVLVEQTNDDVTP